jgi:hypothetical protein
VEPSFPDANRLFLEGLRTQGALLGQRAMVQAMAAGSEAEGPAASEGP